MDFFAFASSAASGGLGILWAFVAFLLVLTPLVFIHELGHFLVARFFNVRIETFSIGFGREIFGWTDSKDTRWKVSLLPLGGYVKFWGDDGAASIPDREKLAQMAAGKSPAFLADCFHFKPLWQRAAVVAAGPVANFLLALVVLVVMLVALGDVKLPARIGQLAPGGAALESGLRPGDVITKIDGDEIRYFDEIPQHVVLNAGNELNIEVCRGGKVEFTDGVVCQGGETIALKATPKSKEVKDRSGKVSRVGQLGIVSASAAELSIAPPADAPPELLSAYFSKDSQAAKAGFAPADVVQSINGTPISYFHEIAQQIQRSSDHDITFTVKRGDESTALHVDANLLRAANDSETSKRIEQFGLVASGRPFDPEPKSYNPIQAVGVAAERMVGFVKITLTYLGQLVTGRGDPSQLSGPIGIANAAAYYASVSLLDLVYFASVLSISLGLINLFPIPMLDGGHLLYYAFEAVRGRPLGEKAQEIGFRIGLALVLFLMVFATWNDLVG